MSLILFMRFIINFLSFYIWLHTSIGYKIEQIIILMTRSSNNIWNINNYVKQR